MHFGMGLSKVVTSVRRLIVTGRSHVQGKVCGVCLNIRDTFLVLAICESLDLNFEWWEVTDRPYTRAHTNTK